MLDKETVNRINNFVAQKPRTIQEIAQLIGRNWRTADSYITRIETEQGTIASRTFRGGTKGALKIVYWNLVTKNQSTFQEALFERIRLSQHKEDFSPFDIYQYVDEKSRECFIETQENNLNVRQKLIETICAAERQVLMFSGDLSWALAKQGTVPLMKIFKTLASRGVPMKVLCNVDLNSFRNVQKVAEINASVGKELIEIRHCVQPLRAFVVDDSLVRFKEKYFLKKRGAHNYIFYSVTDKDWVGWMQKVFWHHYSTAISATKRIKDIQGIREMDGI